MAEVSVIIINYSRANILGRSRAKSRQLRSFESGNADHVRKIRNFSQPFDAQGESLS